MKYSFCIPARDEQDNLPVCLGRIIELFNGVPNVTQDSYEMIVGDHGSEDDTARVAERYGATALDCSGCSTVAAVRNRCAAEASGDVLVFLDADVQLGRDWLRKVEGYSLHPGTLYGSYPIAVEQGWIHHSWFSYLHRREYIGTGHMFLYRSTFNCIGGFDDTLETGEDYEFCKRAAQSAGVLLVPTTSLYAFHIRTPQTLREFYQREYWHGTGDWRGIMPQSSLALYCLIFSVMLLVGIAMLFIEPPLAWPLFTLCGAMAGFLLFYKMPTERPCWRRVPASLTLAVTYMLARANSMSAPKKRNYMEA